MITLLLIGLAALILVGVLVALVHDPEIEEPAMLESGHPHEPRRGGGGGWLD